MNHGAVILGLLAATAISYLLLMNHQQQKVIEKFEMFYLDRNKKDFQGGEVTGLAYGDFFAVWSEGRSIQEVMGTCLHEYAHNEFNMVHPTEAK